MPTHRGVRGDDDVVELVWSATQPSDRGRRLRRWGSTDHHAAHRQRLRGNNRHQRESVCRPQYGGTLVTIKGTNFVGDGSVVDFGSNGSQNYDVVSSSEITAYSPANTSGGGESLVVNVTVEQRTVRAPPARPTISRIHRIRRPRQTRQAPSHRLGDANGSVTRRLGYHRVRVRVGQVEAGGAVSYTDTRCAQTTPFTGTSAVPVSLGLTGLSVDTTYDYMVYVQYSCGAGIPPCSTSRLNDRSPRCRIHRPSLPARPPPCPRQRRPLTPPSTRTAPQSDVSVPMGHQTDYGNTASLPKPPVRHQPHRCVRHLTASPPTPPATTRSSPPTPAAPPTATAKPFHPGGDPSDGATSAASAVSKTAAR